MAYCACMRFELLELGLELSLSLVHNVCFYYPEFHRGERAHQVYQQAESHFAQDPPKTAMSTWLPYTLIDQLLVATNEQTQRELSKQAISLRRDLHREVLNGARRAQKLGHCLYDSLRADYNIIQFSCRKLTNQISQNSRLNWITL
jgi:hypothetical protein